ncbi:MAG TPA: CorA family divalent cation transporter [Solirubrobacterales bacterium]|jgi:magnesium transporter|nr:CorA family divalent cation transporter [Solirubrobacterales bacterium]
MSEIVTRLDEEGRGRISRLRAGGHFFWADLSLRDASSEEMATALGIPPQALRPLLDFGHGELPSRKFHADGDHVVFPFTCYLETDRHEGEDLPRLGAVEVNVLVHGDYLLTLHREPVSLPQVLPDYSPEGRSEQYVVYAVLDAMVGSAFDALNDTELALEGLQVLAGETANARVRMGTLRAINLRLSKMRRELGPQRGIFERISQEIGQVKGLVADSERYFERIYEQLNRLIDGIDAAADSLAKVMDLRLNETMYWLTVVATIFLPLTFLTGFFGMNFGWMIGHVESLGAFLALGIGGPLLGGSLIWLAIKRRGTPVQPDQDAVERLVAALRRPLG